MPSERIGDYALERLLGRGSFGEVHLARDRGGAPVAIKLLLADPARETDARKRFEREARSAMGVRHPNVVAALGTGTWQGRPYLVCEYAPGGSLHDLLRREGRLAPERALALAAGILRGLVAIHAAGLVHRDLKPANVLLAADGRAQVADLGLTRPVAMQRTVLTRQGMILGTPAYVAPEQIEHGESVDGRADLYSAGIVLYQLLTGTLPFVFSDPFDLLRAHVGVAPPDPARRVPLAPALSGFVLRLLAKKPAQRPRDAAEALATIESLRGQPAETLELTLPDQGVPDLPTTLPDPPEPVDGGALEQVDDRATIASAEAAGHAALRLRDESGAILFLYAGAEVTFGRDAAPGDETRACLRVLSGTDAARASLRMSGRHLALRRDGGAWTARDLGSSNGTRIDGEPLGPGAARELRDGARLSLAGAVELRARVVPPPAGTPRTALPASLLLERQGDGAHHRYLLVAAPVALDPRTRPVGVGSGAWTVLSERGLLWSRSPAGLEPAARLALGHLRATPIQPDDAKR